MPLQANIQGEETPVPECIVRQFKESDSDWLMEWYKADRKGMESFMGVPLEAPEACMSAFNRIFEGVIAFQARFWVMDLDEEPMGFFLVTDIDRQRHLARIHIYVGPDHRRYSLKVAQVLDDVLVPELREMGVRTVVASQPFEQRGAYGLAKRMGFTPVPTVMLTKEI